MPKIQHELLNRRVESYCNKREKSTKGYGDIRPCAYRLKGGCMKKGAAWTHKVLVQLE
ncbi:hypothetical protein I4000191A8_27980 [Clostridia bacterium i40-0019-1A8]